jgi:hypothetical protein
MSKYKPVEKGGKRVSNGTLGTSENEGSARERDKEEV